MSLLTVVRHGQASFLSDNYDKLSEIGERQSRELGAWWARQGVRFDRVYTGPAERHRRTAELAAEEAREAGIPFPEPVTVADLDEFPAEEIGREFVPVLAARNPEVLGWLHDVRNGHDYDTRRRAADRLLYAVATRWASGEFTSPRIRTWQDFCAGVEAVVRDVTASAPKSSHVVLFTSGGPTAVAARVALGLSDQATIELLWSPRNASFAEFRFTTGRFSLSSFNATPHLNDPELLTYR